MKFDCGETLEEKKVRLGEWHNHFCWFPVIIGPHDCRWLEVVMRRGRYVGYYTGHEWLWEYKVRK